MQTGDNAQDPRPGEKDDETPGLETATQSRGENWAAHTFTARTAEDPDDPDESDESEGTESDAPSDAPPKAPPKVGATPPP